MEMVKRKNLAVNQLDVIREIIDVFPVDKSHIEEKNINEYLYEITVSSKVQDLPSIKFTILKEKSEILIFINNVEGAYYEGNIDDIDDIKEIIKTVLKSEIKIENFYRKGKSIGKKIYLYIEGKEIDTFLYTEKIFWKLLYKEKKVIHYKPWLT